MELLSSSSIKYFFTGHELIQPVYLLCPMFWVGTSQTNIKFYFSLIVVYIEHIEHVYRELTPEINTTSVVKAWKKYHKKVIDD